MSHIVHYTEHTILKIEETCKAMWSVEGRGDVATTLEAAEESKKEKKKSTRL